MRKAPFDFTALHEAMKFAASRHAGEKSRFTPGHGIRVFERSVVLADAYGELERIVEILERTGFIPDMRLLLKLYVIGWTTLSDIAAGLINEALDLGCAAQDLSFGAILRNTHVIAAGVPAVLRRHRAILRHEKIVRVRNVLVHQGKFNDEALDTLERAWSDRVFQKFCELDSIRNATASAADPNPDTAVDAANRDPQTSIDIRTFRSAKCAELRDHLKATGQFLRELDECLALAIQNIA